MDGNASVTLHIVPSVVDDSGLSGRTTSAMSRAIADYGRSQIENLCLRFDVQPSPAANKLDLAHSLVEQLTAQGGGGLDELVNVIFDDVFGGRRPVSPAVAELRAALARMGSLS